MLNIQQLRERPEEVRAMLARRHSDTPMDEILSLDLQRRELLQEAEALKARRNEVSRELGRSRDRTETSEFERLRLEMRQVGDRIKELEAAVDERESRLNELLLQLPNLPDPSVPEGEGEHDNQILRTE